MMKSTPLFHSCRNLQSLLAVLVVAWFGASAIAAAPSPGPDAAGGAWKTSRNVTFISTSDCHYREADRKDNHNEANRQSVEAINAITNTLWPEKLGGDPIERPRGVVVLGDVIDDGDKKMGDRKIGEEQYQGFLKDFGLDGSDCLLKYPVFEGWGNHDGPPEGKEKGGFSFQGQLKKRNQLRKQNGLISGLSENGLHYSWDWDDVHFVQLNLYPADQQRAGVRYSAVWHDPQGALAFLKKDLAQQVGTSGRPVVLMSHCGFDTDWWCPDDWKDLYDAAQPYNVVLYLYGHSGTGLRDWAPEGRRPWTCINDGQTENGFFVIQIAGDRLRAAHRWKEGIKTVKEADGTVRREWNGKWGWRFLLDRKISSRQGGETRAGAEIAPANLALVAKSSTSYVSGHETIAALNDGFQPAHSDDKRHGAYGNWPRTGTQWVEYEWSQPISTGKVDVYWFDDARGVRLPKACRIQFWNGKAFVPVEGPSGLALLANRFNTTSFAEVRTTRLRLEMDGNGNYSTGILEWRVYDLGKSPNFAPLVTAGEDRVVVLPGKTWLRGTAHDDGKPQSALRVTWSKESGPGEVAFQDGGAAVTTARFSAAGDYVLRLTGDDGQSAAGDTLRVAVVPLAPAQHLVPLWTKNYAIHSRLWNDRAKKLIMHWIPHCYNKISDLKLREGGIDNFVQAGNKLAGRPFTRHTGPVFANAWVHNTVEAMCVALLVDPQGDPEIIDAQKAIRAKLDDWLPKILSAQEPDGYLQTCYTLNSMRRWSNKHDHEGYLAGYFIQSAIAHYLMTNKADDRMYRAARKLADCWCENIGPPPKRSWYDGHEELEQALVRLARLVEDVEGAGRGRPYVALAKFLLDCRRNGEEYDQSHLPVTQQYEAVGHAVRAVYCYSAMADVAMETRDVDYQSAVQSLWSNLVHKKYYVTGGVGSGETSEGFGKNYSLPNRAYCESCANCGGLFFQHKLNLLHHDARYADLYEETLYNAILGDVDLEAKNFTYTNPLDSSGARYPWHGCPCCVGNIPRTLLMLPTWMYAKGENSLYVNLFIGSTVTVENVAGTDVQMVQATDYPWSGKVSVTVNPKAAGNFAIKIRLPSRTVSKLYSTTPDCGGLVSLAVNGATVTPTIDQGYAVLDRTWKPGDRIDLELPLPVQRIKADRKVAANVGRVALRRGPLIYNIESVDQNIDLVLNPDSALSAEWKPDLLGGVMVINGTFAGGTPLVAIPNYARNNRGGRSIVWIKDQ